MIICCIICIEKLNTAFIILIFHFSDYRLTFWLSNCVVLRAIITQAFEEQRLPISDGPLSNKNAVGKKSEKKSPKLTWKASASNRKDMRGAFSGSFDDWEDPFTFISALEKVKS